MRKRIGAHAAIALVSIVGNPSSGMDAFIARPELGRLALCELGASYGVFAGSYVQNADGSIDAWTSAQKRVLPEELEADQRKLVKTHVARHPHGPLAKAFAEHTARVRALRLWQARAPRRPTASRHTSAPRAPRAARRVRRAASPLARSPDEPPSSEGGDGPPPDAEPWGAP